MKKKIFFAVLLTVVLLLTGCVPSEVKEEAKQYKKEGVAKIKAYLNDRFEDYVITESEQAILGDLYSEWEISPITTCKVEIGDKNYVFAYDRNDDTYWSDYYYADVVAGFEKMFAEYGNLKDADSCEFKIGRHIEDTDYYLLLHEDETFEDVFTRKQDGDDNYFVECSYYFSNESNFVPSEVKVDKIYDDISDLRIYLHNTDGKGKENYNILDTIQYEDGEFNGRNITIHYAHREIVKINEMYFAYDDNYYDVEISETEYDNDTPESSEYKGVKFINTGEAYLVKATRVNDKAFNNSNYYESYVNDSGITIHYYEDDVDKVLMYCPDCKDDGLFAYDSFNKDMHYMFESKHFNYASMTLRYTGYTEGVLAIYKR